MPSSRKLKISLKKVKPLKAEKDWDFYRLTPENIQVIEAHIEASKYAMLLESRNVTDHCHKTGLVRGRLGWKTNYGLGLIGDSPQKLRLLADYLENPPAVEALGKKVYGLIGQAKYKRKMRYGG